MGPVLDVLFIAASVLIPLAFGLVPAFLPQRAPPLVRWLAWLALVALLGWYVHELRGSVVPYPQLALIILIVSAGLSLIVLVVETIRSVRHPRG